MGCGRSTWGATSKIAGTSGGFLLEAVQESQLCGPPPTNHAVGGPPLLAQRGPQRRAHHTAGSAVPNAANHCCLPEGRLDLPRPPSRRGRIRAGTPVSWSPRPAPPCCGVGGRRAVRGRPETCPAALLRPQTRGPAVATESDGCLAGTRTPPARLQCTALSPAGLQSRSRGQECQQDT